MTYHGNRSVKLELAGSTFDKNGGLGAGGGGGTSGHKASPFWNNDIMENKLKQLNWIM